MTHFDLSIPRDILAARQREVFERLGDGVLVLSAAPVQHSSRDTERRYCPDRELYYLTGLTEPETVAVFVGGGDSRIEVFARRRDADAELWAGARLGMEAAGEIAGAQEAHAAAELEALLPDLLAAGDRIFGRFGQRALVDSLIQGALSRARALGARAGTGPRGVIDPGEVIDPLRLLKDAHELDAIRRACGITVEGHRAGAAAMAPGVGEWEIEAAVDGAFRAAGGNGPGFETIVGSGENGCVLHYVANARVVGSDVLVLVDAGAEAGLYHGDVTRTYPASGSFSPMQKDVYEVVEAALAAGIAAVQPGALVASVHEAGARVLIQGLLDLGVLEGTVDSLFEQEAYKPFFPHQTSHWLGLDVHDPGDYARDGASRALEENMVFTVEPGLYFRPEVVTGAAEKFGGIGVRIEDDVVVTATGCEVLTGALPTDVSSVEALVRS